MRQWWLPFLFFDHRKRKSDPGGILQVHGVVAAVLQNIYLVAPVQTALFGLTVVENNIDEVAVVANARYGLTVIQSDVFDVAFEELPL